MSELIVANVTKRYGKKTILDDLTVKFEQGHSYGLLGRNGAGKSTLINIIMQRCKRESGAITFDGQLMDNNDKLMSRLFCMNDSTLYPSNFRVKTIFSITDSMYDRFDMEYAVKTAEMFGLDLKKRLKQLSTGYNTVYKVILALASNADFVFLDEPVLGIDVNQRELFYKTLARKMADGTSCFIISTHIIEEIQNLIDRTMILHNGKILLDGDTETLMSRYAAVSGKAETVDAFTSGRSVICTESMGVFKKAVFEAEGFSENDVPEGLSLDTVNLQQLFYYLTGGAPEEK
ncbi:MAG: ABC transporter ATP-binding protein [Oscillospiraceae bacterium]|nr:ABC transporter ATP-binding protein [Oscillospiraceae bacterium]